MFNAEKLLGGLIRSSTRGRRGLGGLVSSGVALGALGVAMEAVEHYMGSAQPSTTPPSRPSTLPPPSPGVPPPPPVAAGTTTAPPPPPPIAVPPTDNPPAAVPDQSTGNADAVLLIRAMIAAANADRMIDAAERDAILARLQAVDLSPEEHAFIARELLTPADMDTIVDSVRSADMARQVYAVSFMAIAVDTDAERRYMDRLAERLGLDQASVDQIARRVRSQ